MLWAIMPANTPNIIDPIFEGKTGITSFTEIGLLNMLFQICLEKAFLEVSVKFEIDTKSIDFP